MIKIWKQKILLLLCSIISMVFTTNENENKYPCPLCFEDTENDDWKMTNCGHEYCKSCLKSWRTSSDTCPECRANLNSASPLIDKIKENDIRGVQFIVGKKPNTINQRNEKNETPLTVAVQNGNQEMVELLIHIGGVDLELVDKNNETPIEVALKNNHRLIALKLFEYGASFDNQMKMFEYAVMFGSVPVVQLFINKGKLYPRALIDAIMFGHLKIAEMLINAYPEMLETGFGQMTPLLVAIERGQVKMVNLLIQKGANIKCKTKSGFTAFCTAIVTNGGNDEIVQLLIQQDKSLIEQNCDTPDIEEDESCNSFGPTPLMMASGVVKNLAIVQLLLENGADIMKKENSGNTALMFAVNANSTEIIDFLIKTNPETIFQMNNESNCAFTGAVIRRQENIVSHFLNNHGHLLHPKIIERAFSKPTSKNIKEILKNYQEKSLICALYENNITNAKKILKHNRESISQKHANGTTHLMWAARQGYEQIVIWLLDKHVSVRDQNTSGETALIHAACGGHVEIIKRLIKKDSTTFNQTENTGHSALSVAAKYGQTEVIKYFLCNKYELISHEMLQFARKHASTKSVIETKLNLCKSIFESIKGGLFEVNCDEKNEKRVQNILTKNPSMFHDKNEIGETPLAVAKKVGKEKMINLILKTLEETDAIVEIKKERKL